MVPWLDSLVRCGEQWFKIIDATVQNIRVVLDNRDNRAK